MTGPGVEPNGYPNHGALPPKCTIDRVLKKIVDNNKLNPAGDGRVLSQKELLAVNAEIDGEFPVIADQTDLTLIDVDPWRLRAFWSVSAKTMEHAHIRFGGAAAQSQLLIRLREIAADAPASGHGGLHVLDRQVISSQGNLLIDLPCAGAVWEAELGLNAEDGGWLSLARSGCIQLPPARPTRDIAQRTINVSRQPPTANQPAIRREPNPDDLIAAKDPSLRGGPADRLTPDFPNTAPAGRSTPPAAAGIPAPLERVLPLVPEIDADQAEPEAGLAESGEHVGSPSGHSSFGLTLAPSSSDLDVPDQA